jgi:hypothetical protein
MAPRPSREAASAAAATTTTTSTSHSARGEKKNKLKKKSTSNGQGSAPSGIVKHRREKGPERGEATRRRIQEQVTQDAPDEKQDGGDEAPKPTPKTTPGTGDLSSRLDVNLLLGNRPYSRGPAHSIERTPRYYPNNMDAIRMVNQPVPTPDVPTVKTDLPSTVFDAAPFHHRPKPRKIRAKKVPVATKPPAAPGRKVYVAEDPDKIKRVVKNDKLRAIFSGKRVAHARKATGMKMK